MKRTRIIPLPHDVIVRETRRSIYFFESTRLIIKHIKKEQLIWCAPNTLLCEVES